MDVQAYLARIGFEGEPRPDLATLTALQRAHLTAVPFENLHVFNGLGVRTDTAWSVDKIVTQGRGGWCFENNGAFAALLEALGFEVARLGAAVLLDGPNEVVDHLTLEVRFGPDHRDARLVDVGFGDSFIVPLELNRSGPQVGGTATFELVPGAQGTTLTQHVDGVPQARYRFKRVTRQMDDFDDVSRRLQHDPDLQWSRKPFATRLLDGGPDRVTLLADRLKIRRGGVVTETPVAAPDWADTLRAWFAMSPLPD